MSEIDPHEPRLRLSESNDRLAPIFRSRLSGAILSIKSFLWIHLSPFGAGPAARHVAWALWKNVRVMFRTHISHWLSIILVALVFIRELPELLHFTGDWTIGGVLWLFLILIITFLTLFSAAWELLEKKLSNTEQERRFGIGIRNLQLELEKFGDGIEKLKPEQLDDRLSDFAENFIKIASSTICGKTDVDVGILVLDRSDHTEKLLLYKATKGAHYPPKFSMKLTEIPNEWKGPAFMSFTTGLISHMPNKAEEFGYLFKEIEGEEYKWSGYIEGWYPVEDEYQDYRSVLCVPVGAFVNPESRDQFGILSFTTSYKDPYIRRDYIMALCLAYFLGEAMKTVIHLKEKHP